MKEKSTLNYRYCRMCRDKDREIKRLREYTDKLAAGLPEGMLPADVINLRESNSAMATELEQLRAELALRPKLREGEYGVVVARRIMKDAEDSWEKE
jgi:hypothetical protein